ncbi:MAG: Holliday junction branch migration protein RuvA [Rhodospirillaceae bacterium]|nr:Holliday junction branch migration protein RuvA [Rhodospirillaceae bacterium]
MIAQLSGRLVSADFTYLIIDVQGVGYLVHATGRTLAQVGQPGDIVTLLTELLVREDSLTLYGFKDTAEQAAFRMLQTVQGVGAKAALSILTTLPADELSQAILAGDKAMVSRAEGIGPKLAQRIINELAQKLPASLTTDPAPFGPAAVSGVEGSAVDTAQQLAQDALSALVNLGYSRTEAFAAISQMVHNEEAKDVSALIALALKQLGASRS